MQFRWALPIAIIFRPSRAYRYYLSFIRSALLIAIHILPGICNKYGQSLLLKYHIASRLLWDLGNEALYLYCIAVYYLKVTW